MALITLLGWLLYMVLAFGYRTYAQLRATGQSGFVGVRMNGSHVERAAGAMFAVALVAGLCAPLIGVALPESALAHPLLSHDVLQGAGALLYGLGLLGTLAAQFSMGTSWRIGVDATERTALVTGGPFSLVRNPIFTAMAATGAGLLLLFPTALASIAYVALLVALELQVRFVEEPYLVSVHGGPYLAYAARTGRFVPGFGLLLRR